MPEKSAFEGLFDQRLDKMPQPAERNERRAAATAAPSGKGRQPGKRSDPAWKQHTVMLRKENHLAALDRLRREDRGQDISDLLDSLLEQWLKKKPKT
jgi:hypothetical protein